MPAEPGLREEAIERMAREVGCEDHEAERALTAFLALLDERGFAVVPKAATEAEIDAAYEETKATKFVHLRRDISLHTLRTLIKETRAAMLAAFPNPLEAPADER